MRDSLELIREMGVAIEQIRLSGGGARNPLWRQIQADIYGHDVHTLNAAEGPAFGVALLAQVGTGGFASVPEACDATIRLVDQSRVDPAARASTIGPTPSTASSIATCGARSPGSASSSVRPHRAGARRPWIGDPGASTLLKSRTIFKLDDRFGPISLIRPFRSTRARIEPGGRMAE